jgi:hypothetical protein
MKFMLLKPFYGSFSAFAADTDKTCELLVGIFGIEARLQRGTSAI